MDNRIDDCFAKLKASGEKAFIPFITAGDPDLDTTVKLVQAMAAAGADIIELGVPYSEPVADGPVIQAATQRSLEIGTTLAEILKTVQAIRQTEQVPLVLMSYYNPILQYGLDKFIADA
jgi:tryptophan synthase alpha chain